MKRILILILTICSIACFGQVLQDPSTTPSTARTNEAISGAYTVSGTDTYTISPLGSFSYTYLTGKAVSITFPPAQVNTGSSTLNFDGLGAKNIQKWSSGSLVDVSAGDLIGTIRLRYDGTRFVMEGGSGSSGGSSTFSADVTFTLPSGFTLGKYDNGDTAPWTGLTAVEALQDAAIAYINPTWNSFTYSGFTTQAERGITLSGSKTFTWSINANSGVVSTIDIYDVTAGSALISGTANDGTQAQTITTVTLSSVGSTQSFRGIANNSSPSGTINSSTITTTAYLYNFYGSSATAPTTSANIRALPSQSFDVSAGSFTLATGTTNTIFTIALPPGRTLVSVFDTTIGNVDITSSYISQTSINVADAGAVNAAYVIYRATAGVPYSGGSHNHVVTYN